MFLLALAWWGWILAALATPPLLVILIFLKAAIRYKLALRKLPADIPRHPETFIISMFDKAKSLTEYFDGMRDEETGAYYPVVNAGPYMDKPYLWIQDPETIKSVLTSSDVDFFPKLPTTYDLIKPIVGNGLVVSQGAIWHAHRQILTPLFHFNVLKQNATTMVAVTHSLLERVSKLDQDKWVSAKELFAVHALTIIVKLAFGDEVDVDWVMKIQMQMNSLFANASVEALLLGHVLAAKTPFTYSHKLHQYMRELKSQLSELVQFRRKRLETGNASLEDQKDLFGVMILGRDENGHYATNEEIVDEALTFLFAGYDTSSSVMSTMLWMLGQNLDVQEKLQKELDEVLKGQAPTLDDLPKLRYLKNVIRETMRLWPVVMSSDRYAKQDVELDGITIPAGTGLGLNFFAAHRDPRYYDIPEEFVPERWDHIDTRTSAKPHHTYSFLPFSAGARNCIGQKFAFQEIVITMAMLMQKYSVSYDESKKPYYSFEVVSAPANLFVKFHRRS